jgi:glycosyl transferase family 2
VKLVMTMLVRDEEDILAASFDFHLSQGIDFFLVMDNLSVDGTRDIIESYVRSGVALYLWEPGADYSQARWVTGMARTAASHYGADWVINSDADEFWLGAGPSESIKEGLERCPPQVLALTVPRSNCVPVDVDGAGFFAERMTLRERKSYNSDGLALPPKVCHRGFEDVEVDQGNHCVRRAGVPLVAEPCSLRILHYPLRSYKQFENKIIKGGAAYARNTELSRQIGSTWRNLHKLWQQGGLPAYYSQNVISPEKAQTALRIGDLVYDDTVRRAIAGYRATRTVRYGHG